MGGDDYVIDGNGAWNTISEALVWYRGEVTRLRDVEAKRNEQLSALLAKWRAHPDIKAIGTSDRRCSDSGCAIEECADELEEIIKPPNVEVSGDALARRPSQLPGYAGDEKGADK